MKNTLPVVLENCLEAMEQGASLDQALAAHPQWAEDLRPLLLAAQAARTCGEADVAPEILAKNKRLLLEKAAGLLKVTPKWWNRPLLKAALAACFILLLLAGGVGGVVAVSESSLPGDPLYGIKRRMETIQLQSISDPEQKSSLEENLNLRRVDETNRLLQENRQEMVHFHGILEQESGGGWVVSGIPLLITNSTEVEGVLRPGSMVEVLGSTQKGGAVMADQVIVTPGDGINEDDSEAPDSSEDESDDEDSDDDRDESDTAEDESKREKDDEDSEDSDKSEDEPSEEEGDTDSDDPDTDDDESSDDDSEDSDTTEEEDD